MLQESPYILYSDGKGNIFEDTSLYTTGRSGWDALPVDPEEWIELPDGGSLYELPGRRGIGIDDRQEIVALLVAIARPDQQVVAGGGSWLRGRLGRFTGAEQG